MDGPRGHENCVPGPCEHGYGMTTHGPFALQGVVSHKYFEWRAVEKSFLGAPTRVKAWLTRAAAAGPGRRGTSGAIVKYMSHSARVPDTASALPLFFHSAQTVCPLSVSHARCICGVALQSSELVHVGKHAAPRRELGLGACPPLPSPAS